MFPKEWFLTTESGHHLEGIDDGGASLGLARSDNLRSRSRAGKKMMEKSQGNPARIDGCSQGLHRFAMSKHKNIHQSVNFADVHEKTGILLSRYDALYQPQIPSDIS